MTKNQQNIFESVLKECEMDYRKEGMGLYWLGGEHGDFVQTEGFNLKESIHRLVNTETFKDKLM